MKKNYLAFLSLMIVCLLFLLVGCNKEKTTYTISFETDGGTIINSISLEEGSSMPTPATPLKEDYTFMGWYMDENLTTPVDFNKKVDSNITLYAKWVKKITIFTVNDFHGAIETRARQVAGYIMSNKDNNFNNTVVLSAGDMLQGSGISNLNYGVDVINIMNIIGFDAMTVGNHEFDWELSTVLNYFDGNTDNGEANFPLLGCNVIDKRTNALPVNMQSHTVFERAGLKIAVIGYIGLGLEDSIATNMVANYEFVSPVPIISELSYQLRTEEDVDIVIACGHDASSVTNEGIANLSGDYRVDAIVNGHTHARANGSIQRQNDDYSVPYVQADDSGEYVGKIELTFDPLLNKVTYGKASNQKINDSSKINEEVDAYVDDLIERTAPIFNRVIGVAGRTLNQGTAADWACNMMLEYAVNTYGECDVAFTNIGGLRNSALPINLDEEVTVGRIFELMPFDNTVKMVSIKGNVVRNLITMGGELAYSDSSVTTEGNNIYINGVLLDNEKMYRLAVIDYIFDKDTYPFLKGENIISTGKLLRDIMIEAIEASTENDEKCF